MELWRGTHGKDERGDDGPEVVAGPAKADDEKQLPLVPAHSDLRNLGGIAPSAFKVPPFLRAPRI